ncbi:hypothetical protein QF037_005692 [Streptomyces canus]|nr:hypothetical protein [Streptomyces canus]
MFSTMDTATAAAVAVFATAPIALLVAAAVWLRRR